MFVCFHVCLHLVTCVGAWERQTDGRTESLWGQRKTNSRKWRKFTQPTLQSSRSCSIYKDSKPHYARECVCVRLSMCVCVCVHKSMFSCELFVFVWAHLHDCGSAWVHACALKLINTHNWRLPVIWRWGQRKLFCGTLIILVRTPGYKYCQRYALHPAFLSALHPSPKWETGVLQENKSKISMQWVVFRFFTTSLARVCSGVRFSVNA